MSEEFIYDSDDFNIEEELGADHGVTQFYVDQHDQATLQAAKNYVDGKGYVVGEEGKGLSSNDYTDEEKQKLEGLTDDYTQLQNIPTLNGVQVIGSKNSEDYYLPKVIFDTTENWETRGLAISEANTIYVWTDYKSTSDGPIAGFKVGDGLAYIIDLPFTDAITDQHINNTGIHVTPAEKTFWNNKNRAYANGETLILTIL